MRDSKSFASSLLKSREPERPEDVRDGFTKERQQTSQAFSLRLGFKDGRKAQGLPWAFYAGHEWIDDGKAERLTVLFTNRAVVIEGQNLWRLVEELEEGQLKAVQEHDSKEVEMLRAENADVRRDQKKPIITGITAEPPFAEILKEIRGDEQRNGFARRFER